MKSEDNHVFDVKIRAYFKKLSILTTQIPYELRRLLLPSYMLCRGVKSYLYYDSSDKLGFEICRERASRFSVKMRKTEGHAEQEIFGFFGEKCAFNVTGGALLHTLVFTSKDFADRYEQELPKEASVLKLQPPLNGLFMLGDKAELKVINCAVYFIFRGKRFVKYIPFAWLFGSPAVLSEIDPLLNAESDFYDSLFSTIHEIINPTPEKLDPDLQRKSLQLYAQLIEQVETEFKNQITITKADEQVFQQLLPKYKFFLDPEALLIESQPILRGETSRKPDFHIQPTENKHIYVEIEPPFCKPFDGKNISARFNEALNQVSQWRELLKTAQKEEQIRYMIIIGFLDDLNVEEKAMLANFKAQDDLVVVSWDWILSNVEKVKQRILEELKRH